MDGIIENANDQEKEIMKNSIAYLYKLTESGHLNIPTVKSLYRTKCKLMELRRHIVVDNSKYLKRCERCFLETNKSCTKFQIQPLNLPRYARKVISKVKNHKILTNAQQKYYKKLCVEDPETFANQNKMVKICNFCQKQTVELMTKPEIQKPPQVLKYKINKKKKKKTIAASALMTYLTGKKKQAHKEVKSIHSNTISKNTVQSKKGKSKKVDEQKKEAEQNKPNPVTTAAPTASLHARIFASSDITLLEEPKKKRELILSKDKTKTEKPPKLQPISKAKTKQQNKKMTSLTNVLKNSGNKKKEPNKLKNFLESL